MRASVKKPTGAPRRRRGKDRLFQLDQKNFERGQFHAPGNGFSGNQVDRLPAAEIKVHLPFPRIVVDQIDEPASIRTFCRPEKNPDVSGWMIRTDLKRKRFHPIRFPFQPNPFAVLRQSKNNFQLLAAFLYYVRLFFVLQIIYIKIIG